jgi:hypothetical protein
MESDGFGVHQRQRCTGFLEKCGEKRDKDSGRSRWLNNQSKYITFVANLGMHVLCCISDLTAFQFDFN